MTIAIGKLTKHAIAVARRAWLWVVYQFSPTAYWNLRSQELHQQWFDDDADYRIYHEFLLSLRARTCLEIGCNGGRFSRHLVNDLDELVCQDISAEAIEICRASVNVDTRCRITFLCGNIADLYAASPATRFDVVISNRVLSAVRKDKIAMTITVLGRISRHVIINELMPGDAGATYYWFAHDYDQLFKSAGLRFAREVVSNGQRFRLYSHIDD